MLKKLNRLLYYAKFLSFISLLLSLVLLITLFLTTGIIQDYIGSLLLICFTIFDLSCFSWFFFYGILGLINKKIGIVGEWEDDVYNGNLAIFFSILTQIFSFLILFGLTVPLAFLFEYINP